MLLMFLLIPNTFKGVFSSISEIDDLTFSAFDPNTYAQIFNTFVKVFTTIFSLSNFTNWLWWIFIILGMSIATHMTLSKADIQGSVWGFVVLILLYLIVDLIIYFISSKLLIKVTALIIKFSFYIISLLTIGVIILIVLLILTFILGGFKLKRNY